MNIDSLNEADAFGGMSCSYSGTWSAISDFCCEVIILFAGESGIVLCSYKIAYGLYVLDLSDYCCYFFDLLVDVVFGLSGESLDFGLIDFYYCS